MAHALFYCGAKAGRKACITRGAGELQENGGEDVGASLSDCRNQTAVPPAFSVKDINRNWGL
jgi:hypothetical protein